MKSCDGIELHQYTGQRLRTVLNDSIQLNAKRQFMGNTLLHEANHGYNNYTIARVIRQWEEEEKK